MVKRRHQVFVSSTYLDLQSERRLVMQRLLEIDCIPVGMEWFPASDEPPWSLIDEMLSESDYYVVIVGHNYGSVDATGISFTEREYDEAKAKGLPRLAFLYDGIEPNSATEQLLQFRAKIEKDAEKTFKKWSDASQLANAVQFGIQRLQKTKPRDGWVREPDALTFENIRSISHDIDRASAALRDRDTALEGARQTLTLVSQRLEQIGHVQQSLGNYRAVLRNREVLGGIYAATVDGLLREPLEIIDRMAEGRLLVEEEWIGQTFDILASSVNIRYDGVSKDDLRFWLDRDQSAVRYLKRNRELADKGLPTTRLFILPRKRLTEQRRKLGTILSDHTETGIGWALVIEEELPPMRGVFLDYGLFDRDQAVSFFKFPKGRRFEVTFHTKGRLRRNDDEIAAHLHAYHVFLSHCVITSEKFVKSHMAANDTTFLESLMKSDRRRGITGDGHVFPFVVSSLTELDGKLDAFIKWDRTMNVANHNRPRKPRSRE